jgi:hypothetical protein
MAIIDSCRGPKATDSTKPIPCVSNAVRLSDKHEEEQLYQDSAPFVVFSACEPGGRAFAGSTGGFFTDALLKTIHQLDPGLISTITYEGLLAEVSRVLQSRM